MAISRNINQKYSLSRNVRPSCLFSGVKHLTQLLLRSAPSRVNSILPAAFVLISDVTDRSTQNAVGRGFNAFSSQNFSPNTASSQVKHPFPILGSQSALLLSQNLASSSIVSTGCLPLDKLLANSCTSLSTSGQTPVDRSKGKDKEDGENGIIAAHTRTTTAVRPEPAAEKIASQKLQGGLPPGRILELSGPPGSCKEKIVLGMVKEYVKKDMAVLVAGTSIVLDIRLPPTSLRI